MCTLSDCCPFCHLLWIWLWILHCLWRACDLLCLAEPSCCCADMIETVMVRNGIKNNLPARLVYRSLYCVFTGAPCERCLPACLAQSRVRLVFMRVLHCRARGPPHNLSCHRESSICGLFLRRFPVCRTAFVAISLPFFGDLMGFIGCAKILASHSHSTIVSLFNLFMDQMKVCRFRAQHNPDHRCIWRVNARAGS